MQIRPYQAADWTSLCEIHDAARRDELRLSAMEQAFLPLEKAAHAEALFEWQLFVAELDRRVLGFVAYSATELGWLYVSPNSYRRGVGRALVRHALAQSDPGLRVEVLVGNEPALQLYLSEGFRILRRVDGRLAGNEEHAASGYILEFAAQPRPRALEGDDASKSPTGDDASKSPTGDDASSPRRGRPAGPADSSPGRK